MDDSFPGLRSETWSTRNFKFAWLGRSEVLADFCADTLAHGEPVAAAGFRN